MAAWSGLSRSSAAADSSTRSGASAAAAEALRTASAATAAIRNTGSPIASASTPRVAGLRAPLVEIAGEHRREREREPQPDAVRRRLRGQFAEHDLQPPARILVASKPPLLVGQRNGQRQPLAGAAALERVDERVMRGGGVAGRGLGVGERELEPAPAFALGRPVGEQAQRGGVEAGRGLRCRALQLRRRVAQQRDRVLVPGVGGVLDVMGALHGSGAAPLERLGRAGMGAEPPPRRRGDIDGVVRDRMPEREAPRHPGRSHEPALQQLVERAQRRRLRQLRHRGGQLGCERVAHDRRGLEQRPRVRRELGVLGGERRRDGRRDRVVVYAPTPSPGVERTRASCSRKNGLPPLRA